jgi:hypothetical protein
MKGILNITPAMTKMKYTPQEVTTVYYDCHTPTGQEGSIYTENDDEIAHLIYHLESQGFKAKSKTSVGGMPSSIDWRAFYDKKGEMVLEWRWWILALKSDISRVRTSKFSDYFELKPEYRGRKLKKYGI